MFGPDILVAPVLYEGERKRRVYLPEGAYWTETGTGRTFEGGTWIESEAPLDTLPLFVKNNAGIKIL